MAASVAVLVTVFGFGGRILANGLAACSVAAHFDEYGLLLPSPCSCGWVALLAVLASLAVLGFAGPRWWRTLCQAHRSMRARIDARRTPGD